MKKSIIIGISVLLNIGLIYLFLIKGETTNSADSRTVVVMSEDNRDFVFEEMRDFLESIQQINEGILNNDPAQIIRAGKKSGGSVIAHAPQGLLKSLPVGFKSLGFSTHDMFDEFARNTEENYDPIATQNQLNKLLNNCVACHRSYKISLVE